MDIVATPTRPSQDFLVRDEIRRTFAPERRLLAEVDPADRLESRSGRAPQAAA